MALLACCLWAQPPAYAQSAPLPMGTNAQTDILMHSQEAAQTNDSDDNGTDAPSVASPARSGARPSASGTSKEYVLGIGDHLLLNVYGEDEISGEYIVGSTGVVALPLIGNVQAGNNTVGQLEAMIRDKLAQGYLKDPKVSVEVSGYRPFFILGEVAKPGSYPYVNGMTVLNAVALAGGYTYRASTSRIKIVHAGDPAKEERPAEENASVAPGDVIRVPERYF